MSYLLLWIYKKKPPDQSQAASVGRVKLMLEADRAAVAVILLVEPLNGLVQSCEGVVSSFLEELYVTLHTIGAKVEGYSLTILR